MNKNKLFFSVVLVGAVLLAAWGLFQSSFLQQSALARAIETIPQYDAQKHKRGEYKDGQLVVYIGHAKAKYLLRDEVYGFIVDALVYQREMRECKGFPTCWAIFNGGTDVDNPMGISLTQTIANPPVHIDKFVIDESLLAQFKDLKPFVPKELTAKLRAEKKDFTVDDDSRVQIENPGEGIKWQRVHFSKVDAGMYTIIAELHGKTFKQPKKFSRAKTVYEGGLDQAQLIKAIKSQR